MTYVPPHSPMKRDEWPTLKEMLDSGKRLVVFMDKGADEKTVPFLLPQFPNVCPTHPFLTATPSLSLLTKLLLASYSCFLDVGRRIRSY